MKKIYLTPRTETVAVKLFSSFLEDDPTLPVYGSKFGDDSLGKEQDGFFETDSSFGDIWSDSNSDSDPNDLWGE